MSDKRQAGWASLLVTAAGRRKPFGITLPAYGEQGPRASGAQAAHSPPPPAARPASASRICALLAIAVILAT